MNVEVRDWKFENRINFAIRLGRPEIIAALRVIAVELLIMQHQILSISKSDHFTAPTHLDHQNSNWLPGQISVFLPVSLLIYQFGTSEV